MDAFLIYTNELKNATDSMTDEQAGKLIKALCDYVLSDFSKTPVIDDKIVDISFKFLKGQIERGAIAYKNRCEINRMNGSKGGRPKKQNETQKNPSVFFANPTETEQEPKKTLNKNKNKNKDKDKDNIYVVAKAPTKQERADVFKDKIRSVGLGVYSNQMLHSFFNYWTESNEGQYTKMRFEKEKTFDIKRRLERWSKNDYNSKQNGTSNSETSEDRIKRVFGLQ